MPSAGWRLYLGLLPMQIHVGAATAALLPLACARADPPSAAAAVATAAAAHRPRPQGRPRRWRDDRGWRGRCGCGGAGAGAAGERLARDRLRCAGPGAGHPVAVRPGAADPGRGDWRLRVSRAARPEPARLLDLAAVAAMPQFGVRAVLDCTGGWYTEQEWRGVRLAEFGLASGAVDRGDLGHRLPTPLPCGRGRNPAVGHAGAPDGRCRPGTAAPARLVAPGRRGFWWVKCSDLDRRPGRALVAAAAVPPAVTATSRATRRSPRGLRNASGTVPTISKPSGARAKPPRRWTPRPR